jgi:hypothetical protein
MEIFEVRLSAASGDKLSELARCLADSFADLEFDGRLETFPTLGLIVYRCAGAAPDERQRLAIHSRAAEGMAEYVLTSVEPELIRIMIRRYYPCGDDDAERIAELCARMLGGRPDRRDGGPAAEAFSGEAAPERNAAGSPHAESGGPGKAANRPTEAGSVGPDGAKADAFPGEAAEAGAERDSALPAVRGTETDAPSAGGLREAAPRISAVAGRSALASRAGAPAAIPGGGADGFPSRARRKRHIAEELLAYLQERPSLHLEGYITFRLDKYWEELAEAAEAAVDEFVTDRQYREFVGLLNEFVGRQQPRVSGVNLVLKADGGFALYDEAFRPMDPAGNGRLADEFAGIAEEDLNVEDMVVSCLLAISPREITLHARDHELPVVRTIGAIFAGRVTLCAGCRSCRPLTGAVPN